MPVLAIWGEADTVVPIGAMGRMTQWIRNSRQETVKTGGHSLLFSHPDEVAGVLKSLLLENR